MTKTKANYNIIEGDNIKPIINKSDVILEVENRLGENIEEVLRRKFVDENKLTKTIANELSISYVTAFRWLKRAGIYSRKLDI